MVRIVIGPVHKRLLPAAFMLGGAMLCICDTIARAVMEAEIPVGIITAIVGAPFFIYLLRARNREVM